MISVAIMHTPWVASRVRCLKEMLVSLGPSGPDAALIQGARPKDMGWHQFKTVLALTQWEWALSLPEEVTHHLFLTDDLHMAPDFTRILEAMVAAKPNALIGLLSNHPRGPELAAAGERWYRCNSWLVGPAYVVPRHALARFVAWYKDLPDNEEPGGRRWFNDDSALNEWNTHHGNGASWHPLPTPIEHRADIESTVGHGDRYSRERVSWRYTREVETTPSGTLRWLSTPRDTDTMAFEVAGMVDSRFWECEGAMLPVGG